MQEEWKRTFCLIRITTECTLIVYKINATLAQRIEQAVRQRGGRWVVERRNTAGQLLRLREDSLTNQQ